MKEKHLKAHLKICEAMAALSRCPRRKFGAVLVDPRYNAIISTGYNGPPRGEEGLCGGAFCAREGLHHVDLPLEDHSEAGPDLARVTLGVGGPPLSRFFPRGKACDEALRLHIVYPPIKSGTHMEVGCHHAEANVLANAMRRGIATEGAWLIVTGEPCAMCAKFLHHGGIAKVFVVKGGYAGGDAGVVYLKKYGVAVEYVDGPQDPRTTGGLHDERTG